MYPEKKTHFQVLATYQKSVHSKEALLEQMRMETAELKCKLNERKQEDLRRGTLSKVVVTMQ